EYEPEDLTVTAECGVTLATLRATLAARGQELPLEAPGAGRTTLGGTLAANASGPRRLRFGAPRARVLGARFVLGDGTLARSGGAAPTARRGARAGGRRGGIRGRRHLGRRAGRAHDPAPRRPGRAVERRRGGEPVADARRPRGARRRAPHVHDRTQHAGLTRAAARLRARAGFGPRARRRLRVPR